MVDQGCALLDEGDLIATERAQGGGRFVLRQQGLPGVAIGTQGVGQTPGVVAIGLGATGSFAFAIALSGLGVDRIKGPGALQQLIDRRPTGGFQGQRRSLIRLHLLAKLRPAGGAVRETKLQDDLAQPIDHGDVMMIASPIQSREMSMFRPLCIHSTCGLKRRAAERARPDTGTLMGRCSLSAWSARGCRTRRSPPDPRRAWGAKPWVRQSRWSAADTVVDGGVIHNVGRCPLEDALPAIMNNSRNGIRG